MKTPMIIIIGGGSFQGKSLTALHISAKYKIPTIVSTDAISEILGILTRKKYFTAATYMLSPELFKKSTEEISRLLIKLIEIYIRRGESMIIEGIYIAPILLDYAKKNNLIAFGLNCELDFVDRLRLKFRTTRKNAKYKNKHGSFYYDTFKNENIQNTTYFIFKKRIIEIHKNILKNFRKFGFPIINFVKLEDAYRLAEKIIEEKFNL